MKSTMSFWFLCFVGVPPILALAIAFGSVVAGAGKEISDDGRHDPEPPRPEGLRLVVDNPRDAA